MDRAIGGLRTSVLLLTLGAIFLTSCTGIFYFPRVPKQKFYDPAQLNLKQEEVEVENENGIKLHAWWFNSKTQPAKGTVIYFHGNAENLTTHFITLSWLPDFGYNYLIWDYPGYGVSEGKPSTYDNVISAHAVIQWVHDNKDQGPLIIYGASLGGNIAARAVLDTKDRIPYKALILEGTYLSNRSIARKKASESWITWIFQPLVWLLMEDAWTPKDISKVSPTPLLVIHGQKDIVIPPSMGEEIFTKAAEPKQIWRVPEGRHIDTYWMKDRSYRQKLVDYLNALK